MKKQSIAKGFAVLTIASMFVKILSVLYIPFLRGILGDEGYGIYGAAYQVYTFIYVIANSGIPVAISKTISELTYAGNYKDALRAFKIARSYLIGIGAVLAICMFVFAGPISRILHFEKSYLAILALSPTILITSISSAYRGYFQGRSNMTNTAVSQIIEQIANVIFTLLFAMLLMRYSLEAACAGGTIGTSMGALASMIFLGFVFYKKKKFIIPKDEVKKDVKGYTYKQLAKRIINYSIPITIAVGATYAGNLVDMANTKIRLMTGGYIEAEATILYGFLTKYQQLMNVPISIVAALAAAVLPSLSGSIALNDKQQFQNKLRYSLRLCLFVVVPSAVGFSILSEQIYSFLKFGDGFELMKYGAVVLVFMSLVQIQTTILQGAGRLYIATRNVVIGIIAKILINYFLISIPDINIYGAIIGSVVGFGIALLLNTISIKKHLNVNIYLLKNALKPLVSSIIMGGMVFIFYKISYFLFNLFIGDYFSNVIAVIISIIVGVVAYVFSMIIFKGITKKDLIEMPDRLKKFIPSKVYNRISD
ncbi:polysaccharide biosynthesis protein [Herbivorax sp. ANBcel31]|uniref:putative polysaccharide biosynthesis protein n=1 Tax=Herbivorax sp. ANBcel31 TaxID=3069754 RepID=UPI0027B1660D|nr:polysaccharide biosynthesis protein [Herbivorax sp. ANBcel31]MDQ2085747.1 polysaccharide biosynthesis protein [Herbivorax sp. ANBcel31]